MSTDNWCTPKWLAEVLGPFAMDPCTNDKAHIVAERRCFNAGEWDDGLKVNWLGSVFCNPPYSNPLPWAQRLVKHDGPWCALVKLDPSTRWYATLMEAMPTVAPFRKRLKFEGEKAMTANFPSVLIYSAWRPPPALVPHLWLPTYGSAITAAR